MTGAHARAVIRARFVPPPQPEPVAEVRDHLIPGPGGDIPVRIYRPDAIRYSPILVYAHGGGFVFCDLDSHDGLCRYIANRFRGCCFGGLPVGARASLARGRRRFLRGHPVGGAQCLELGGDAGRVVVGGDSAGGNLAAVTALMARDRGGSHSGRPVPALSRARSRFVHQVVSVFGHGYYNPRPAMQWYWDQVRADQGRPRPPVRHAVNADLTICRPP